MEDKISLELIEQFFKTVKFASFVPHTHLSKHKGTKKFFYDEKSKSLRQASDKLTLRMLTKNKSLVKTLTALIKHFKRKTFNNRLIYVFGLLASEKSLEGVIMLPRRGHTMVVLDYKERIVYKVFSSSEECHDLINKEEVVQKCLTNKVPKIVDHQYTTDMSFVKYHFVPNDYPVRRKDMPALMQQIVADLIALYDCAGIKSQKLSDYTKYLVRRFDCIKPQPGTESFNKDLDRCFRQLMSELKSLEAKYKDVQIYSAFTHGDIAHPNIRRSDDKYWLIDWNDAGYKNILYDMFMTDYQNPNALLFSDKLSSNRIKLEQGMYGSGKRLVSFVDPLYQTKASDTLLDVYLMLSLIELLLKMKKYQKSSAKPERLKRFVHKTTFLFNNGVKFSNNNCVTP